MLLKWRLSALVGLTLLAGTVGFAKAPAKAKAKNKKSANSTSSATAKSAGTPSPAAKQAAKASSQAADPALAPIAATTGTLGLFTVETGELLPKHGFSFDGYANKFTRMPGSVSFLQYGVNVAYGLSDRFNIYLGFLPEVHSHISDPNPGSHLSLDTPVAAGLPLFPGPGGQPSMYRVLGAGQTPGYLEDYPFAAHNGGGVGPVTIGVKFGLLSERSGAPVSLSVRNDFIIPTVTGLGPLLVNGTQTGQFNDQIGVALSKNWNGQLILTGDYGFRFTKNPSFAGVQSMDQAKQSIVGVGFVAFPQKRIQLMTEYTAVLFSGGTANDSFGARDPVDGVWGVRLYPQTSIAVDLGYRYMLNLSNAEDRSGFVIKIGATLWPSRPAPAPVNHSPVAACSQDKTSVFAESNDVVNVTATASDPDGDPINYTWSATGGRVDGTGPRVRWLPAAAPGSYTITLTVDDGRGGMATCAVDARVDPRPNRPPTVTLSADRDTVLVGERVHFTATGADPDNDPLTYTWRTNGGNLNAAGTSGDLDTTGLAPASYTVTVRVDDGRGGAADASRSVNVQAPPPPPQSSKINGCDFKLLNSARVDNICKRVLDDVALRLQNEPRATVVIIGYADPRERQPDKLAGDRSGNAAKYLTDKGLASARVNSRAGSGQAGAGQANRRIDVIWVPEGATY